MRKHFNGILLLLVLVGLPLGSYLYLKSGFQFRKNLIDELKQSSSLKDTLLQGGIAIPVKGRCTVVSIRGNAEDEISLYDQFKDARGFQMVVTTDTLELQSLAKKRKQEIGILLPKNYFHLDTTRQRSLGQLYPNARYLILDTLGQVRMVYTGESEDMKRIAGHITVLLPLYKEK